MRQPRAPMRSLAVLLVATIVLSVLAIVQRMSSANAAETYPVPSTGTITVYGHGNGHGHGLSQYGARGAALAGHSAAFITAFYYPGTTPKVLGSSTIRVLVSNTGSTTVVSASSGISLTGVGTLSTTGVSRFRLVAPSGVSTLRLDKLVNSTWSTVKSGIANGAEFSRSAGTIRLFRPDGSSTTYRGAIRALRGGTGTLSINRVSLDGYTEGVVPREMPASWPSAAVQAQAIAARSYGRQAVENNNGKSWDICDSDQCQVYGGMTRFDSAGNVLWNDDPAAIQGNQNTVLQYGGATIFAQFSASNGGWTVDGGKPYLVAKADPYDNVASGDPYLNWTRTPSVASIADYYGLHRVTNIVITSRDGNGQWGGRVLSGIVQGTNSSGQSTQVTTTGFGLENALDLPHDWFTIAGAAPSAPRSLVATPGDARVKVDWSAPSSSGNAPITGYVVSSGASSVTVGASVRTATVIGLRNGVLATVTVRAISNAGTGTGATITATPEAAPQRIRVLPPVRLFDTRTLHVTVDSAHPFTFAFAGAGNIPATAGSAQSVQFALTIINPSASGALRVQTVGAPVVKTAAIAYRAGRTTATTVSVPITPTSRVRFVPSSGTVTLTAAQLSFTGVTLGRIGTVPASRIANLASVPLLPGVAVTARGVGGVPDDATGVILSVVGGPATATGWLRLWADGAPAATVSQVSVTSDGTGANTVIVPIGADGKIRIAAQTTALAAQLSVVGYVAPADTDRGRLETFQPVGAADAAAGVGSSLHASTTASTLVMLGKPQVPTTGVQAVWVQLTVSSPSEQGALYVYPAGGTRPTAPSMTYAANGTDRTTATVLVRVGTSGAIAVETATGTAVVSVDTIGWVGTTG